MRVCKILALMTFAAWPALLISAVHAQPPGPPGGRGGPMEFPQPPVMTAIDADGNGEISAEELAGAAQALAKLDKNGDGKLDRNEIRPQFAGRGGPGGPGPGAGGSGPSPFQGVTQPKDDAEAKIVQTIDDILKKQGRRLNVPTQDGRMLRALAESLDAKTVVEFGTSNGISAIWMSLALRKTGGKLFTHEIDPNTAALARENFAAVGVAEIVTVVEGDGHEKAKELKGPIDLVFIDADKEGYLDYFQKTLPLVRPGGIICAHNMTARMADAAFVKEITTNPDIETLFFNEGGGLSISVKKR